MLLQLKIQLEGISKPPVWRRVLVPEDFSYHKLHQVIQQAFGWSDTHLYQFSPKGYGSSPEIVIPNENAEGGWTLNSQKVKISNFLCKKGATFKYIYDFGDDWIHKITVEEVLTEQKGKHASFIDGKGSTPPEDCGGVWGYAHLLEVIKNPDDPEYKDMREWLGLEENEDWNKNDLDKEWIAKAGTSI